MPNAGQPPCPPPPPSAQATDALRNILPAVFATMLDDPLPDDIARLLARLPDDAD